MNKPTCKVHGMIQRGAMCGHIIVGAKHCGYSSECRHKIVEAPLEPAKDDAAQSEEIGVKGGA